MEATEIDLVALRRPRTVIFPNGTRHAVEPYRGPGQVLLNQYRTTAEDDHVTRFQLAMQLVALAVPTATEDDRDSLSIEDWPPIIAAANGNTALLEAVRKNVESDGPVM